MSVSLSMGVAACEDTTGTLVGIFRWSLAPGQVRRLME